jgi:flagella basal body P-ring formation protein FlgA
VKLFWGLLTFFVFSSSAWAQKFDIRVAEKSTVRLGEPVRLGQLITGHIQDVELSDRVYNLVVFEAITGEEEKSYSNDELALTLRRKLSFQDLQRLQVKIPEQIKVQAQRNYLSQNDLMREINERALVLCTGCSIEFDDFKVPELRLREEVLQTHLDTQNLKGAGSFLLPLQVETSQKKEVFWVTGKISFYKQAPVAKRLIPAGERISENDVEMKKVNVSFAKDGAPSLQELAGQVSARTIAMGQPIFLSDLKKEPAAKRGQIIKIFIGNDNFEVVTTGTAEEGGSIGDVIKVKSAETQKMLSGLLVDKATVRIQ